jgi:hypothetical protein
MKRGWLISLLLAMAFLAVATNCAHAQTPTPTAQVTASGADTKQSEIGKEILLAVIAIGSAVK